MSNIPQTKSLAAIGECMLELREVGNQFELGYGGDVFNTAVYAKRRGIDVAFYSATGDDHYSNYLMNAWRQEGLQTDHVRIISGKTPGLYIIKTDERGERSFHYWRDSTPFKNLLDPGDYLERLPSDLAGHDMVYFSGISLALFAPEIRTRLIEILKGYREQGGLVAFDPNYRPRLWESTTSAITWIDQAYSACDIALPSLDDEFALREQLDINALCAHLHGLGVSEVVIKNGREPTTISSQSGVETVQAMVVANIKDTTAAGDSFNGAYLAARLHNESCASATSAGSQVAATVIQHSGAVIPPHISLTF